MVFTLISLLSTLALADASFNNMADDAILGYVAALNKSTPFVPSALDRFTYNNTIRFDWYPYTDTTTDQISSVFTKYYCKGDTNLTLCQEQADDILRSSNFTDCKLIDNSDGDRMFDIEMRMFAKVTSLSGQIDFSVVISSELRYLPFTPSTSFEQQINIVIREDNMFKIQGHLNGSLASGHHYTKTYHLKTQDDDIPTMMNDKIAQSFPTSYPPSYPTLNTPIDVSGMKFDYKYGMTFEEFGEWWGVMPFHPDLKSAADGQVKSLQYAKSTVVFLDNVTASGVATGCAGGATMLNASTYPFTSSYLLIVGKNNNETIDVAYWYGDATTNAYMQCSSCQGITTCKCPYVWCTTRDFTVEEDADITLSMEVAVGNKFRGY